MSSLVTWVQQSPSDDFWLAAAILIGLTVFGFIGAFYFYLRKRVMQDTPTSKIRSAAQGYVELNGHGDLLEGPPIIAPLTGSTCRSGRQYAMQHSNTSQPIMQKGR